MQMNTTGVAIASVLGLLAAYLYLDHEARMSQAQSEATAERRCVQARADADFARRFGEKPEIVAAKANDAARECQTFASVRAEAASQGEESRQDRKDLKDSINNLIK